MTGTADKMAAALAGHEAKPAEEAKSSPTANGPSSSSAPSPPAVRPPFARRVSSESLEDLEDEAMLEAGQDSCHNDVLWQIVSEAEDLYPTPTRPAMRKSLRTLGVDEWIARNVKRDTSILHVVAAFGLVMPSHIRKQSDSHEVLLPILHATLLRVVQTRQKLREYNTVSQVLDLLRDAKPQSIVILSGAGISTSCGIPDFRSEDGIYARLKRTPGFLLHDPTEMFHMDTFLYQPEIFYSFAKDIYPSNFKPSPTHRFIKLLEDQGQLLRNYTQNIDTLEQVAGIKNVLNCHGSFATASCVTCDYKAPGASIKDAIFAEEVPECPRCLANAAAARLSNAPSNKRKRRAASSSSSDDEGGVRTGIMKPDIVFFGENLSDEFDKAILADCPRVGFLIVIGSSLAVAPVSKVVSHLPPNVPAILINRTLIEERGLDVVLLGDADFIVEWLSHRLGWKLPMPQPDQSVVGDDAVAAAMATEASGAPAAARSLPGKHVDVATFEPERWKNSHIWLFPGAKFDPNEAENGLECALDSSTDFASAEDGSNSAASPVVAEEPRAT